MNKIYSAFIKFPKILKILLFLILTVVLLIYFNFKDLNNFNIEADYLRYSLPSTLSNSVSSSENSENNNENNNENTNENNNKNDKNHEYSEYNEFDVYNHDINFHSLNYFHKQKLIPSLTINETKGFDKSSIRYIPSIAINHLYQKALNSNEDIIWSNFAYVQYATNIQYLCSCLMNFVSLRKFNAKADLVLLYNLPYQINDDDITGVDELFENKKSKTRKATEDLFEDFKNLNVILKNVDLLSFPGDDSTWQDGFTKFQVFNLLQYDKIVHLDSDALILNNMDELFFLPESQLSIPLCPNASYNKFLQDDGLINYTDHYNKGLKNNSKIAIPQTSDENESFYRSSIIENSVRQLIKYNKKNNLKTFDYKGYSTILYNNLPSFSHGNLNNYELCDQFFVLKPSTQVFSDLLNLTNEKDPNDYDMDIFNKLWNFNDIIKRENSNFLENANSKFNIPELLIIPHKSYGVYTGEFRNAENYHDPMLADPQHIPLLAFYQKLHTENDNGDSKSHSSFKGAYWTTSKFWNAKSFYQNIKSIHFSDWPVPKPWIEHVPNQDYIKAKVLCPNNQKELKKYYDKVVKPTIIDDCESSKLWNFFYEHFKSERENICELPLMKK
ncbi:glycosyltransferase family 8 protein [Ascoidea rubescens DSM 1968]|uniref:Glycosyltransferase family 8 protein n=1 Tax=Ascoidea rubescens DSM 1968 TaxID=1344418 RepID=A0A1D2VHJ1_9ASCO|nr:glycosyltransferase family 8 protein [Ascoidea rubescens DSM 1968]ODV60973.1 glycosyltransferase family 8 protein [Ascoidea rubescens DSM 1968]